jgi:hypothetical protein
MAGQSLSIAHLNSLHSATDVHELFRRLGYDVDAPAPFEAGGLDALELDEADRASVARAFIVAQRDGHTIYLYELRDLGMARLRSLAWHALQRGSALLVLTRDYRDVLFVDPRFAGRALRSSVRVSKLRVNTAEATRHDLDTLNAIHAHRRTGLQIDQAQRDAFNVTVVTKRFYDEYRQHYERARAAIRKANPGVRDFYDDAKLHAFTQRLLGRMMFLYFLQRKGWLGGRSRFLTERFHAVQRQVAGTETSGESYRYYHEVLEPLFFDTLNTHRPGGITPWEGLRIPYLNGGLFDRDRDPAGPIVLPDSLFDPYHAEGLLRFFNRYNFTIANDTPLEQDVAVDPEMLGKVFENLLEERDRGQSGSFYTPRPIVAYMCQEALAGYAQESAAIPRDTIRRVFDPDAAAALRPDEAARLNAALDTLTVLDPAVGSGSFLIGMLNEVLRLRAAAWAALNPAAPAPDAAVISGWKEAIIRDTLYGVDIKPEAIEIAQLRLWLALVVDQTLEQARPLPNLDYKLMAGNSLIETIDGEAVLSGDAAALIGAPVKPMQPGLGLFEADRERRRLDEMRRDYFSATPEARRRLRPEMLNQERVIVTEALREKAAAAQAVIDQMGKRAGQTRGQLKPADERRLKAALERLERLSGMQAALSQPGFTPPFFLYRLYFSEVFERKGGFDIVVANPPYVRGELLGAQKDEFKVTPIYADVYAGTADLYVYFYARGYDVLKPGGQLAYITSNKYLRANYGRGLRRFLAKKVAMRAIVDFGDLPVFDAAAYPCIVIGAKAQAQEAIPAAAVKTIEALESIPAALAEGVRLQPAGLAEGEWQIADAATQRVFARIKAAGVPLGELTNEKIFRGVVTGLNEAFVIDAAKRDELISADPRSAEVIKPWLRGRDVKRWKVEHAGLYIIFARQGIDIEAYPAIKAHLEQYRSRLTPGIPGGRKPGTYKWYELQDTIAYYAEFEKPKIIYQKFQVKPAFVVDMDGFYTNDALWNIGLDDHFLLGCLNSKMGWYEISRHCTRIQNGYQLIWNYLKHVRIPNPPADLRERIAAAARACMDAAASHPERLPALEAELNALVYQAYGLDAADIAVIEGVVGKQNVEPVEADELSGEDDVS